MVDVCGARNRHDPWLLGQKPRERDLRRLGILAKGEILEEVDDLEVRLQRFGRKAREILSQVVRIVKLRVAGDRAGQEALSERTPGDEADAEFLAERKFRRLGLTHPK